MRAQNQEAHAADMSSSSELASTIEASGPSDAVGLDDGLVAPMNTETSSEHVRSALYHYSTGRRARTNFWCELYHKSEKSPTCGRNL